MTFLMFGFDLGSKLGYFQKLLEKLGSFWATFDVNLGSLFRSDLATLTLCDIHFWAVVDAQSVKRTNFCFYVFSWPKN